MPVESEKLLLASLLDLPEAERAAYLAREYRNDPDGRQRIVEKLDEVIGALSKPF